MTLDVEPKILGHFIEELPDEGEYITIGFSPMYAPLKKRWENNGLSADFISEYFKNFYVSRQEELSGVPDVFVVENLRDAVKYIANELLENAMKFQDVPLPFTARIFLSLYSDKLIFSVTNGISIKQAELLQNYIQTLLSRDPQELYFETMRASAREENEKQSGLGLLSMICDYSAKLGWKFASITLNDEPMMTITTMVTLDT